MKDDDDDSSSLEEHFSAKYDLESECSNAVTMGSSWTRNADA